MAETARAPAVAGTFYPASGRELAKEVERCFLDERGPGELPPRHRSAERRLVAAIVPHAGYRYSGAIAAHVYARLAAEKAPRSVLVLGVDHAGASVGAVVSRRPWLTPLGPTPVDRDLSDALVGPTVTVDEAAQAGEHSIEVQLPFLEYVLPRPSFVPLQIRFGPYRYLEEIGRTVREAVRDRDVVLLASTDFSHYVPPKVAERLDRLALDAIVARDPRALYDVVVGQEISMCGIAPTTALLLALNDRRLRARVLRWGHSGEVEPSDAVVGYAAVVFEEDRPPSVK